MQLFMLKCIINHSFFYIPGSVIFRVMHISQMEEKLHNAVILYTATLDSHKFPSGYFS